jgi:hypothetical protein
VRFRRWSLFGYGRQVRAGLRITAGLLLACAALLAPAAASAAPPTCNVPDGFLIEVEAGQTLTLPEVPCSDPDGDPISLEITQQPTHGTLSPSGTAPLGEARTYTAHSPGDDSISFRALAGGEASETKTVLIRVTTPVLIVVVPNIQLQWFGRTGRNGTVFTRLALRGLPTGSTVRVRCKGSSCPRRRQTFRDTGRRVDLRSFVDHRLRPGTRLTTTITHDARVGVVKVMRIRRSRVPAIRTLCLAPGAIDPQPCP